MSKLYQYKSISLELKDIDSGTGTVSGYFSAFDKVDSYGDVVVKGAFKKTIMEQGPASQQPRIKHLLNHDVTMPIGKLIDLKEDQYGLFYVSQIGTNAAATDFMKMVDSGLVTEHSIGYKTMKQTKLKDYSEAKEGEAVYRLEELKLYEGSSLTGWGVNQYTPLVSRLKSADDVQLRLKRLEKFIKDSTATDECIEMLMLEVKQLMQLVQDTSATQPEETTTVPEVKEVDWVLIALSI